jgi:curved DNA-binding protein CbpA
MPSQIERGLFKFDFTDHHAVLGIPVNADVKEVRKRYLKIARRLHPDSNRTASEAEKKQANQLLSKLVNPAYEQLSQSNSRDYIISLGHMGRRLAAEGAKLPLASETAKQLFKAGPNLDNAYKSAIHNLASKQYESLEQSLDQIAEISELNMVYLMLKGSKGESLTPTAGRSAAGTGTGAGRPTGGTGTGAGRPPTGTGAGGASGGTGSGLPDSGERSRVDEYLRRAKGYIDKNNFAAAVLELREALKLEPNNSSSHSLLGYAYLRQNQPGMAKVHINKALQLNPKDERSLKGRMYLNKLAQQNGGGKPTAAPKSEPPKPSDKPGGSGLFRNPFKKK